MRLHNVAPDSIDVDRYRHLTDVDLRRVIEPDGGYFMAEGILVIERVLSAGLAIESVLTSTKWLKRLEQVLAGWDGPVLVGDDSTLREITGYQVHRGALAVVRRPVPTPAGKLMGIDGHLLVMEDLVDHTNVGLAFRSAAALGITGILLSPACADPLYRRAVKASMGTVLAIPWARSVDWSRDLEVLSRDRSLIALSLGADSRHIEVALSERTHPLVALMVGTEGRGLTSQARVNAEVSAYIEMESGVDSLNVAAAVAVACYALRMAGRSAP